MATLLLAQGTPMILAGDEFGNTQRGNNNSYAQDNEISWLEWDRIADPDRALLNFTRWLISLRKTYPILYRNRFLEAVHNEELDVKDVTWLTPDGTEMAEQHWQDAHSRCFGMLLDGRAQPSGIRQRGADETLLLVFNAYHGNVEFTLPEVPEGRNWTCLVDTVDAVPPMSPVFEFGHPYAVTGRSLLVFVLNAANRRAREADAHAQRDVEAWLRARRRPVA
jgi:isoamylase